MQGGFTEMRSGFAKAETGLGKVETRLTDAKKAVDRLADLFDDG